MLTSLGLIFLTGMALGWICRKCRLPGLLGMMAAGILLGPCVLDLLDDSILNISADLRQIALIIILLKAGLSLDLSELRAVGRPAAMLCCVPASCEILAFVLLAGGFALLAAIVSISRISLPEPEVLRVRPHGKK